MGYIKSVVAQGIEFAENHNLTEYVAPVVGKARNAHPLLNNAVDKVVQELDNRYPALVEQLDNRVDATIEAIQEKKDQALQLKASTTELIASKKTEAYETLKAKKEETVEMVQKRKAELVARKEAAVEQITAKVSEKKTVIVDMVGKESLRNRAKDLNETVLQTAEGKGEAATKLAGYLVRATDVAVDTAEKFVQKTLALPLTLQDRWEQQGKPAVEKVGEARQRALLLVATVTTSVLEPLHLDTLRENFDTYVNAENFRAQYQKYSASSKAQYQNYSASAKAMFSAKYEQFGSFLQSDATSRVREQIEQAAEMFKAAAKYEQASEKIREQYTKLTTFYENLDSFEPYVTAKARAEKAASAARDLSNRVQENEYFLKLKTSLMSFKSKTN